MDINWYALIKYLHVVGAFAFVLAHGASVFVSIKLRGEKSLERIRALLDLSSASLNLMYGGFMLLLIAGIADGFIGELWGKGWIWTALIILILTSVFMYYRGSFHYSSLRKAAGLPYMVGSKPQPAVAPLSEAEIATLLNTGRPFELAAVGGLALAVILWLMLFKPF